jgi:O-antigen ligase
MVTQAFSRDLRNRMATFEQAGSLDRSLVARPSYYGQLARVFLLVFASAVVILGIVLQNYYLLAALPAILLVSEYPVELTLGVFAFLMPFDTVLVLGQSGHTVSWLVGAAAGLVLLAFGLLSGRLIAPPRAALFWGLFILWGGMTLFWALDPAQGLQRLPTALFLFLFYLVVVSFRITPRELTAVILFAVAGGVFASGYTLREFSQGLGLLSRASLIVSGQGANPNDFADSLLLPLALALGGFFSARSLLKRSGMLVSTLIIAYCVLSTMSRGSVLAVAAVLLVFLLRLGVRVKTMVAIALIVALLVFLPQLFFARVQDSVSSRAEGRWDVFIVGTQVVRHYGILGAGLESFRAAYTKFAGFAPVFRGFDRDAHNIYLQVWAELGIIGLGLFGIAIWSQLRDLYVGNRGRRGSPDHVLLAIEAACWALLIHGFAGNLLWRKEFWMAWMLAALAVQVRRTSENSGSSWDAVAHNWPPHRI